LQLGHIEALVGESGSDNESSDNTEITLDKFQVVTGDRPPSEVVLPNGQIRPIRRWKDLLIEPAKFLVTEGLITAAMCPIQKPYARREVLVDVGKPNPSMSYSEPVDIGAGFWIETHAGAYEFWEKVCFLIRQVGQEPSRFRIRP
jgi:hypothetical protein